MAQEHGLTLTGIFMAIASCAAVHVLFGMVGLEEVLHGIGEDLAGGPD
jgi:hypothetical protein